MSQTYDLGIRITADGRIMAAEVGRSQEALQQLGTTAQQAGAQASAALSSAGNAADQLNGKLNRTGVSAAQTTAALRMLPAQMTDIVTGLASGQAPLTVLIQQGGQLKDSFGGVVPAAKALGGYVAGLANPLTIGAVAAAALGVALYTASSEADDFKRNLILTGNASGMTVDRFNQSAAALDNLSGVTRGAAAEALTVMAASGNIGAESIERLTAAALTMEHAGGPAVAETVKQFEALGKSPAEASLKLNEQTRHLTLAVYEQIKALQDQGKTSEAAALAQKAWADAIEQRTPQMVAQLGYLERGWRGVKSAVSEAWDAVKQWGREESKIEQAISLQTRIGNIDDALKDPTRAYEWNRLRHVRQQLKTELDGLNADAKKAQADAAKTAADTARNQAQLAANVAADKLIESQRSKREKHTQELKLLDEQRAKGLLADEKYLAAKSALDKKYEEKEHAAPKSKRAESSFDARMASISGRIAEEERLAKALATTDKLDDKRTEGNRLAAKIQAELTQEKAKGNAASAAKIGYLQKEFAAAERLGALERQNQQTQAANKWAADFQLRQTARGLELQGMQQEIDLIGKTEAERQIARDGAKIDAELAQREIQLKAELGVKAQAAIEQEKAAAETYKQSHAALIAKQQALAGAYQLEQENRRFAAESIFDEQARAQAILDIDAESWRQRIALVAEGTAERQRLESAYQQWYANQMARPAIEAARKTVDSFDRTAHEGFLRAIEAGKPDWRAAGQSLGNALRTAAFDEIYKLTIKPMVINVATAFMGGANGSGAVGGPGGAQQGLSMLSGLQNAWGAFNGGIGNTANSFAMSGVGQSLGLSTGPELLAGGMIQTSGGLTGAGSTLVAAAGPIAAAAAAAAVINGMQKSGWGPDNDRKSAAAAALGGIGTLGAAVIADRLFGLNRNVTNDGAGITGTITSTGFDGQNYQEKSRRGGTFRGDKRWTEYSAVDTDMDAYLDSLVRQTVSGIQRVGTSLGLEAEKAMQGFSHSFSLQLTENGDWSKSGEKVVAELGKVSDELATRLLPNIADFQRYGESASQTLTRLNAEFQGTDAILQVLGKTAEQAFGATGIASAAARERLIDYAGGMDQLASKTASFHQHYFTEQERSQQAAQIAQRQINEVFGALGQAVPRDTAEFKQLVIGQDLSTEAGARLFNQLLDLEGAFYATQQATDAAAKAAKEAIDTARGQQTGLFDRYASDAQKTAKAQGELNRVLGEFGRAVPRTSAEMVRLVQTLDPAVEADQRLLKALDGLTGAFDTVAASATTAADKQISAMQRVTAQMDQVASYKAGISAAQFDIRSKLPSFDAVGHYSQQGNDLRKQLSAAGNIEQRLGIGDQLKSSILNRYQAEQDAIAKTREAARVDFDKRRADAQALLQLQQQGAQNQLQASKQWNDALLRMREYANGLLLSDASTLSPEAKLKEAERQYNAMLQRAKGGDADAAGQLQGNAQAYLAAARDYYASGTGYSKIFDQVQSGVAGLGSRAQSSAALDAAFQQQTAAYQSQALALDQQWQQLWADQSNTWQAEDAELAQKTIDELDKLQQQADAWNEELKTQLQEQALNGVRQTELLGEVASNTANLDIRIASAISGAMSALQAQVTALTAVQAKASSDLVQLTEQNNELLYSIDRVNRLESV